MRNWGSKNGDDLSKSRLKIKFSIKNAGIETLISSWRPGAPLSLSVYLKRCFLKENIQTSISHSKKLKEKAKIFSKRLSSSPLILVKNITSPQKQTKNKIKKKNSNGSKGAWATSSSSFSYNPAC